MGTHPKGVVFIDNEYSNEETERLEESGFVVKRVKSTDDVLKSASTEQSTSRPPKRDTDQIATRRNPGSFSRLAWLPIPVFLVTMAVLWVANQQTSYESVFLLMALNFVFSVMASGLIAYLIGRSFLSSGAPGLLMLGCGVLIWGAAGFIGIASELVAAHGQLDINVIIAIHNICAWLSAICHLMGAILSLRSMRPIRAAGLWLATGYTIALGAVGLVVISVLAGWTPIFFVQGHGGTPVRDVVLASAIAMFAITAILLGRPRSKSLSAFRYWYTLALALIAVGLLGIMIETVNANPMSWIGRAAQFLSGFYMLIAAIASARESGSWRIPLEDALQISEERFRTLFMSVNDGFYLADILYDDNGKPCDYRYIEVNPAFEQILGLSHDQIIGRTYKELVGPDPASGWLEVFGKVAQTGVPDHYSFYSEVYHRHFDTVAFMPGAGQFAVLVRDVTEQKNAEEAIHESEQRYRRLFESVQEMIALYQVERDDQGRIVERRLLDGNAAFLHATGASSIDELRGKTANEVIGNDWADFHLASVQKAMDTGETQVQEICRSETGRHYITTVVPLSADTYLGTGWDITKRKQAEEAVQTAMQRFYTILSSMYTGLLLVTDEGHVEFANQAFCNYFDLNESPTELLGLTASDIFSRIRQAYLYPDEAIAHIKEIVDQGQPVKAEEVAMRNGRQLLRDFVPIYINGKSYGRLWHHTDITERKRMEEALADNLAATKCLQQIGARFVKAGQLEDVLGDIVDAAITITHADMGNIQLIDTQSGSLKIAASRGFEQPFLDFWNAVAEGQGACGTAMKNAKRMIVEDVTQSPIFVGTSALDVQLNAGVAAVQSTPLFNHSGVLIGMLSTHWHIPHQPEQGHLHLLDLLAQEAVDIIEFSRAEAALQESQHRLSVIVDSIADGFYAFDRDWKITHINDEALRYFGRSREEMIGRTMYDFFKGFPGSVFEAKFKKAMETGEPSTFETPSIITDRMVEMHAYPSSDNVTVLFRDVTERKQAEERLASANEELQTTTEQLYSEIEVRKRIEDDLRKSRKDMEHAQEVGQIGSWRLDVQRNVLTWSDENYRIFGVPQGTPLTYETFLGIVHPDDRQYVDTQWNASLRGEPYDVEHRLVVDGQVKWVREKAYLEFDVSGSLLGGFGITQDITPRKQMEESLLESNDKLALLSTAASQLLMSDNPQSVVQSLCQEIMTHLDCHTFFNYLIDSGKDCLHLNAYAGIPEEVGQEIEWLDYGVAVCGCAARDGCRIVAENINETHDPRTDLVKSFGIQAYACHPLLGHNGNVIGTLSFGTRSRTSFTEDDLSLMKTVADQVATAMERVRLRQEAEQRAQELQVVLEAVPAAVWISRDPKCDEIVGNAVANQFYEAEEGENVSANASPVRRFFRNGKELSPEELPMQYAVAHNVDTGDDEFEVVTPKGTRRHLFGGATPLRDQDGQVSGCVAAFIEITKRKQAEEQLIIAHSEAEQRAAELVSFFSSMSDGVVLHDAEGNTILTNDAAREILSADITTSVKERVEQYQVRHLDGTPMKPTETASGRALRGELVKELQYRLTTQDKEKIIAVSSSPVRANDNRILGATTVFRDITDQFELAQQRQDLFEREHRIAETLQQALIPVQIPTIVSGCHFAARYVPALAEAQVGGDFYDVFDLENGRVAVLIGDVAGKGLHAAMQVSAARYAFRSYAYIESAPSKVVSHVNNALCKDQGSEAVLFTGFFAVVDTNNRTITYTNAGHEPPVIRRANGHVEELNVGGRVLGVLPGYDYPEESLALNKGDMIVLITDGITEARSKERGMFGKSKFLRYIAQEDAPPSQLVDRILNKALEYGNGQLQDDVAVVAIGLEQ